MVCPKCGLEQQDAVECSRCGIVIEKFRASSGSDGHPTGKERGTGGVRSPALPWNLLFTLLLVLGTALLLVSSLRKNAWPGSKDILQSVLREPVQARLEQRPLRSRQKVSSTPSRHAFPTSSMGWLSPLTTAGPGGHLSPRPMAGLSEHQGPVRHLGPECPHGSLPGHEIQQRFLDLQLLLAQRRSRIAIRTRLPLE